MFNHIVIDYDIHKLEETSINLLTIELSDGKSEGAEARPRPIGQVRTASHNLPSTHALFSKSQPTYLNSDQVASMWSIPARSNVPVNRKRKKKKRKVGKRKKSQRSSCRLCGSSNCMSQSDGKYPCMEGAVEFLCGLQLWSSFVDFIYALQLWSSVVAFICGVDLWSWCEDFKSGIHLWSLLVGFACGVEL